MEHFVCTILVLRTGQVKGCAPWYVSDDETKHVLWYLNDLSITE